VLIAIDVSAQDIRGTGEPLRKGTKKNRAGVHVGTEKRYAGLTIQLTEDGARREIRSDCCRVGAEVHVAWLDVEAFGGDAESLKLQRIAALFQR
jgi:hypothetical protein